MKFSFLPRLPRLVRNTLKVLDHITRILFLFFSVYAIIFSLAVPYGAYLAYSYATEIIYEIENLKTYNPPMTKFMESLQENSRRATLKQTFIPLSSVSPHLKKAVIAAEDASFYYHPGFDIKAIANAMDANRKRGKTVFGGSTITQQLSKNLFLTNERSWERKFKELIYAVLLEKYLGKDRILELYLNYAQWGKDIFGCEAAAQEYYKTSCADLSLDASINMAAVLASPGNHRPNNPTGRFMAKRRAVINFNMFGHHLSDRSLKSNTEVIENESLAPDSSEKQNDSSIINENRDDTGKEEEALFSAPQENEDELKDKKTIETQGNGEISVEGATE